MEDDEPKLDPAAVAVVLAVDDEVLVLDIIQGALEEGGYAVRAVATGAEALSVLEMDHAATSMASLRTCT